MIDESSDGFGRGNFPAPVSQCYYFFGTRQKKGDNVGFCSGAGAFFTFSTFRKRSDVNF